MPTSSDCPLCKAEKITPWLYEDEKVYVCYCSSHPSDLLKARGYEVSFPEPDKNTLAIKVIE